MGDVDPGGVEHRLVPGHRACSWSVSGQQARNPNSAVGSAWSSTLRRAPQSSQVAGNHVPATAGVQIGGAVAWGERDSDVGDDHHQR